MIIVETIPSRLPQGVIWVCEDCMMTEATGELPPDLDPTQPEPWAREPELDVTPGAGPDEHDCGWDGENDRLDECDCERWVFSWSDCEACGCTLAGSRYAYTWWE